MNEQPFEDRLQMIPWDWKGSSVDVQESAETAVRIGEQLGLTVDSALVVGLTELILKRQERMEDRRRMEEAEP
jgi:hypothetical protein